MSPALRSIRRALCMATVPVAAVALPASAHARLLQTSDCQPAQASQPFAGDESFYEQVLSSSALSDGGSVLTTPACVNLSQPTARVVVSGDPGARVQVDAVFQSGAATVDIPVGSVAANAGVSQPMTINVVNLAALGGQNTLVTLRLSVQGGNAVIGSAWVDPWRWW